MLLDRKAVIGGHIEEGVSLYLLDIDTGGHKGLPLAQVNFLFCIALLLLHFLVLLALLDLPAHVLVQKVIQSSAFRLFRCIMTGTNCPPEGLRFGLREQVFMRQFVF